MLGFNIHCNLAKIKIRCDSYRSCYSRFLKDCFNHPHGKFMRRGSVQFQIIGYIDKHLIDTVHADIFMAYKIKVCLIYLWWIIDIKLHPRFCHNIFKRLASSRKDFFCFLFHFKKPAPSGEAVCFKWRAYSKTDCLRRSWLVCHNKVCCKGIKSSLNALNRCVERFKIYRHICSFWSIAVRHFF